MLVIAPKHVGAN